MYNREYSHPQVKTDENALMTQVYLWMTVALALSGTIAWQVASSQQLLRLIFGTPLFIGLIIGELALVFIISGMINKMSSTVATVLFFVYSALNGATLAVIFMAYTQASIAVTFFVTAGTFGLMSAYGYFTKTDLSKWGSYLFMALIGLIIASLANFFLRNPMLYWIITYAGILIFVGLTVYDTQRIKEMARNSSLATESGQKLAIIGALRLYLDFINLFLLLLRLMGRRR